MKPRVLKSLHHLGLSLSLNGSGSGHDWLVVFVVGGGGDGRDIIFAY